METEARSSSILLATIGGGALVLAAVAIVLAMRPLPQLDPTTPEGAVQGYLQALLDEDIEAARTYLADDVARRCDRWEFVDRPVEGVSAAIVSTRTRGERTLVDVDITETHGAGPFGDGSHTFHETFLLEAEGERWMIVEPPWPIHYCLEAPP